MAQARFVAARTADLPRALALKLGALVAFQLMAALIKSMPDVPVPQAVFARSLFALIPIAFLLHAAGGIGALHTSRPLAHLRRSLSGLIAMACGFSALRLIPLADAVAFTFTATLFTVALSALLLGERVRMFRWSAVAVGFFGVIVMLLPSGLGAAADFDSTAGLHGYVLGAVLALTGSFFMALAMVSIRAMAGQESSVSIVFYFTATCILGSLLALPFTAYVPSGREAALLIAAGVLGGIGQILLTRSYRFADASVLAPFDYSAMLFATAIGYLAFGETPTRDVLIGAGIVIASGLVIFYRERRLGLERGRARRGGATPGAVGG